MNVDDGRALMKRRAVMVSDGFDEVNRVTALLRQRGNRVVSFNARMTATPNVWAVDCVYLLTPYENELLVKHLNRLPSVLKVFREASSGEFPQASASNAVAAGRMIAWADGTGHAHGSGVWPVHAYRAPAADAGAGAGSGGGPSPDELLVTGRTCR